MATNVVFNGVTYSVPAVNEEDWQSLSNYLIALANAVPSGGSVSSNIRVSTSATTAVATSDYAVAINYSSGPATVNLPAGVAKQIFIITDASGTAATNNITINRNGTNTIFGGTSYVMTHNNQSVIIGFSGGNWYRLAESIPGAVEGPASSVVGGIAAFNNTTGDRLQNLGVGTANQVLKTDGTTPFFGMIVNANVDPTAAIAYSKLALTNSIVNADISSGAAIAYSKLNLTGTIVNADVSASAAIAYSKLNLTASITNSDIFGAAAIAYSKLNLSGSIVNADINASAGIVYSKLNLTGGIVNADVNASAAIDYSKLNLVGSIVNADINASAAIARSKIAAGSASHVVVNDGSGNLSSVATLPVSQGGTGLNTLGSALQVLRVDAGGTALEFATLAAGSGDVVGPSSSVTNGIVQFASTTGKAIKDLGVGSANTVLRTDGTTPNFGTITNAYIDAAAAISYSKMESLTALKALVTNGSGALITHPNTTADEIGYLFGVSSNIQTQLNAKLNLSGGTLTGALTINTASNQLVLGSGVNALTVNGGTSAAARTYTVPDVGTTADFVMTAGAQTIGGAKTLTELTTIGAQVTSASPTVHVLNGLIKHGVPASSVDTAFVGRVSLSTNYYEAGAAESDKWSTLKSGALISLLPRVNATDACFVVAVSPIGATPTPITAIAATSTGAVTLGPSGSIASAYHQVNGSVIAARAGSVSAQGGYFGHGVASILGANIYGDNGGTRAVATRTGVSQFQVYSDSVAGNLAFSWLSNYQDAQTANAALVTTNQNSIGSITQAGAWTLGPSGFTDVHTINGRVSVTSTSNAAAATFSISNSGTNGTYLLIQEVGSKNWFIGMDNSTTRLQFVEDSYGSAPSGSIAAGGAWTLGPSGGADHTVNGNLSCSITTATPSGTQNALAIGNATTLRTTNAAGYTLNGIANGINGRIFYLMNTSGTVTINDSNASAAAANRIRTGDGAAITLTNEGMVGFIYDGTTAVWRVFSVRT